MKHKDIKIYYYKSRGPGGQRKNRKETAVKVIHLPTGLISRATEHRFQAKNKELALERLEKKLKILQQPKKKRLFTKKPFSAREKELKAKKLRSEIKRSRKKVSSTE